MYIPTARLRLHTAVLCITAWAQFARQYDWRYSYFTSPLRYSINVTLDGCCDHRAMLPDQEMRRHAVEKLEQADALHLGRVTCEMMEAGWRRPTLFAGRLKHVDLQLVSRREFSSGAVAMRYEPKR